MQKRFIRKIEDFDCEQCGYKISGTGFTNHCPRCLYSKHVDINPGDRQNMCKGLMKPIGIELDHGETVIIHKCALCRKVKRNKALANDNLDVLM